MVFFFSLYYPLSWSEPLVVCVWFQSVPVISAGQRAATASSPLTPLCWTFFCSVALILILLCLLCNFLNSYLYRYDFRDESARVWMCAPIWVWMVHHRLKQWWNVTKYVYSSTAIEYNFEVLILYLSISIFCNFILPLRYILQENTVFFTHYNHLRTSAFWLSSKLKGVTLYEMATLNSYS